MALIDHGCASRRDLLQAVRWVTDADEDLYFRATLLKAPDYQGLFSFQLFRSTLHN
jgi:hypothetical protein